MKNNFNTKTAANLFAKAKQLFIEDSLFRNAVFLMSSTAIMSVLGFGFWIFVAHLYSPEQIGAASALIAITLLISNLSFFGLNSGFIRFLPTSKNQSRDINAVLITVGAAAMVAAVIYILWAGNDLTGSLKIFQNHLWGQAAFVVLMAAVALNTLTDSIFIANRRAEYHTIVYAVFGTVKLLLPIFLIAWGSLGVFAAYSAAVVVSLLLTFVFMRRAAGYKLWSRPNWSFIGKSRKYTTNNYLSTILSALPSQVLPSLIIVRLGQAEAAYFSMAWTMANLLYVIPSAITNSMLAESSHDITKQSKNLRHALRILALVLIPAILVSILVAPYLLRLFGTQYSEGGTAIFQLLAVSALFISGNSIGSAIMNLEHRTGGVVAVQATITITTLGLAWMTVDMGLIEVGLAMLGGNIAGNIVQLGLLATGKPSHLSDSNTEESAKNLTPEVIQALLNSYSLASAQFSQITGSSTGGTVVVKHKSRKYILKIYNGANQTTSRLLSELDFTKYLLARDIPVPRPVRTTDGELIAKATESDTAWFGILMNFEAGQHPQTYSQKLLCDMARVQAQIHLAGIDYAAAHASDADMLANQSLKSALFSLAPKGLGHFDFDGSNLLVENDAISCVLDFGGMRYDPVVVCIVFTLTRLNDTLLGAAQLESYLKAYQGIRPLNWIEKAIIRVALMARYRLPRLLMLRFKT